jgi:Ca2+-dependent lipid-binding protein
MQLNVFIGGAVNIEKADTFGASDPFIALTLSGSQQHFKTTVKQNTLTPVWNEQFKFPVYSPGEQVLKLLLKDQDVASDDELAVLEFPLRALSIGGVLEKTFELVPVKGVKKGGQLTAKLQISSPRVPAFQTWKLPPVKPGPQVLNLRILAAEDIEKADTFGKTDPYIKIRGPGWEGRTAVKEGTLSPKWDEVFYVPIPDPKDTVVSLRLFDEDVSSDDEISYVNLQTAIFPFAEVTEVWLELTGVRKVKKPGRVHVILQVALQSAPPFAD